LKQPPVALAGDDRDDGPPAIARTRMRESLLALGALEVHVRDLDPFEDPDRRARPQRGAGVVRVNVSLERGRIADDEERVAERFELALEGVAIEILALDDEPRAIAIARGRLVDRVRGQGHTLDRLRQGLAGDMRGDPTQDLDQAGRTCV